jgi:beta-glucosidase
MTDWWSVYDGEKLAGSGQDLEMPFAVALKDARKLISEGRVKVEDIHRMAKSILRTYFAMKLDERTKDASYNDTFENHELISLQAAREGIVLLKNEGGILPLKKDTKTILLTGEYVEKLAMGGGSAAVKGYNNKFMLDELKKEFGEKINYVKNPTPDQIRAAEIVLCSIGTDDSEGWDRPFDLPNDQERKVTECVTNNPNTIVIVTSGSGVKMTNWNDKAKAIIYAWYGGQAGNRALAEIIAGTTNPSGKLPMTIEKDFKDSPGYGYIPEGETLYTGWSDEKERAHPVYNIQYKEGIFVGYRWYEKKNIKPLYSFGHGLSYTTYEYSDLHLSKEKFHENDAITVSFTVKNTGNKKGLETVQLYVQDIESSLPRPVKELKRFQKVDLEHGQSITVTLELNKTDFSFWNPATKDWFAEKGAFTILIGSSSSDIRLKKEIELF